MVDVVGTAFVRIKALTNNLAKDIEKQVAKSAKDANVEVPGEDIGERLGKSAGKTFEDKLFDAFGDSTKKLHKKVDVDSGRKIGDRLGEGIKEGLAKIVDSDVFSALGNKLSKALGLDEQSGRKRGRGFGRGLIVGVAKIAALLSPAALGLGSALLQYVVALTAQISLLVVAAAGAGVALGAVFGAAALAILPVMLAFKANTAELEKFKEIATGVGEAWLEVGAATQETLLPGLTAALKASKQAIPVFRGFGREVGRVVGNFAEMTVNEFVGDMDRLRNILQGSSRILDSLSEVAFNFVTIFLDMFESAIPIGEQFADTLERMSDRWQNVIGANADSGQLTATFQDWYDKATLVFGALGDLFVAIWNIITVGSDSAVPFFENFATWAQEFRDFTASAAGQNKLKQIFDDSLEVAHEFHGLITDLFDVIGGQVFDAGGNDGIIGFIRILREDFVPLIDGFATKLKEDYGPALSEFFDAFGDFLEQVARADGLNITLQTLTITMETFTVALTTLMSIPGFDTFLGTLLGLAGAISIVKGALGLVAGLIGKIIKPFKILHTIFKTAIVPVISGLATVLTGFGIGFGAAVAIVVGAIALIAGAVALLVIHWDKVKEAFNATVRFFKDPMERLEALKENIEDLLGTLKELGGKVLGIAGRGLKKFGDAMAKLGGIISEKAGEAFGSFIELVKSLPGRAVDALSDLGGALGDIGETIISAIIDGIKALPGALLGALDAAFEFAFEALRATIHRLIQGVLIIIIGIPLLVLQGLMLLGPLLVDAFTGAFNFLKTNLGPIIGSVLNFFQDLPGNIIEQLSNLGGAIADFITNVAWPTVTSSVSTSVESILQFFRDLPGNAVDALLGLGGLISNAFSVALETTKTAVSTAIDAIVEFFTGLPGRIVSAVTTLGETILGVGETIISKLMEGLGAAPGKIVSLASDMLEAVKSLGKDLINGVIDALNNLLPDEIGKVEIEVAGRKITVLPGIPLPDDPIPRLAWGGVFNKETTATFAEAGREVVIPLTKPARARQLVEQSGLLSVIGARPAPALAGVGGSGTTIDASGWQIVSSDPVETGRQMVSRFRSIGFLMGEN